MFLNKLLTLLSLIFCSVSLTQEISFFNLPPELSYTTVFGINFTVNDLPFEHDFKTHVTPILHKLYFLNKDSRTQAEAFTDLYFRHVEQKYDIPTMRAAQLTYHWFYYKCACKLFKIVENITISQPAKIKLIEQLKKKMGPYFDINCSRYMYKFTSRDVLSHNLGVQTPVWSIVRQDCHQVKQTLDYFKNNGAQFLKGYHEGKQNLLTTLYLQGYRNDYFYTLNPYFNPIARQTFKTIVTFNTNSHETPTIKDLNIIAHMIRNGACLSDIEWDTILYKDDLLRYFKDIKCLQEDDSFPTCTYVKKNQWWMHRFFTEKAFLQNDEKLKRCIIAIKEHTYPINKKWYQLKTLLLLVTEQLLDRSVYKEDMPKIKYLVEFLLQHKADPNIQDYLGETALHHIANDAFILAHHSHSVRKARRDQLFFIELLIEYGANPTITNLNNKTVLDYLVESSYSKVLTKIKYICRLPLMQTYHAENLIEKALRAKENRIDTVLFLLQHYPASCCNVLYIFKYLKHQQYQSSLQAGSVLPYTKKILKLATILAQRQYSKKPLITYLVFKNKIVKTYKKIFVHNNNKQPALNFLIQLSEKLFPCFEWLLCNSNKELKNLVAADEFLQHFIPLFKKFIPFFFIR